MGTGYTYEDFVLKDYLPPAPPKPMLGFGGAIGVAGHSGYSGTSGYRIGWTDEEAALMPEWANFLCKLLQEKVQSDFKNAKQSDWGEVNEQAKKISESLQELYNWLKYESFYAPSAYHHLNILANWMQADPAGTSLRSHQIMSRLNKLQSRHDKICDPIIALIDKWIQDGIEKSEKNT